MHAQARAARGSDSTAPWTEHVNPPQPGLHPPFAQVHGAMESGQREGRGSWGAGNLLSSLRGGINAAACVQGPSVPGLAPSCSSVSSFRGALRAPLWAGGVSSRGMNATVGCCAVLTQMGFVGFSSLDRLPERQETRTGLGSWARAPFNEAGVRRCPQCAGDTLPC